MIVPRKKDLRHKNQLLRLLALILKDKFLANELKFKGGTYAALRDLLPRFSVDLDFDLPAQNKKNEIRQHCYDIFNQLKLEIKDESQKHLQFFLRYESPKRERNTLKLEINDQPSPANRYEAANLREVQLYCQGHTLDTAFANKLVAATARYAKNKKLAGRDFYDLHVFFNQGLDINQAVIEDLTDQDLPSYLQFLATFIEEKLNQKLLQEDLNLLLPADEVRVIVPQLKVELLRMIKNML